MNLRCIYCQTPFTLGRGEMLTAIVQMNEKNQNHYDAHCPRCRRANSISRQRMELFYPNWQEVARHQPPAPSAPPEPAMMPATAAMKTEPLTKAQRAMTMPAAKPAMKKPAAHKPSASAKKAPAKTKAAAKPAAKAKKAPAKAKKKK